MNAVQNPLYTATGAKSVTGQGKRLSSTSGIFLTMPCLSPALATVKTTTCDTCPTCPTEWDWNQAKGLGRFAREAHQKKGWEERTRLLVLGEAGKAWQEGKAKFGEVDSDHSFVPL